MTRELRSRCLLFAAAFVAVVVGYHLMFLRHAPGAFSSPEEDMSYAWYVPLFSLYVLWCERRRIIETIADPSWIGLFLSLPAMFIGFLGIRGSQLRLEILGFALTIIALAWTYFGRKTAARIAFPSLFLCFCMPFATYLDVVTVNLRLLTVSVSTAILDAFGADVVRSGTVIAAADGSFGIDIAAPCSGLRSLFALMALTAGYAYFNQPGWARRVLLFAFSVPIAIVGNIARILSIAFVGSCFSPDFATGFYHDYSGYVTFIVAIGFMLGTSTLISRGAEKCAS